jgi:hypothetical protein
MHRNLTMTSRYTPLYQAIADLEANTKSPDFIPSEFGFPFEKMYPSQREILSKVQNNESFCLTSHTGWGKSPVFLSLTRETPSIVIEPRKFLQSQISSYFHDVILYGRSGYDCPFSYSAASAPCLLKEPCDQTTFQTSCKDASKTCMEKPCSVFLTNSTNHTYQKFPCQKCPYLAAVKVAVDTVRSGGTVICNFGNFWNLLKYAKTVVIDEADLFFREVSAPIRLKYSIPKKYPDDDIKTLLTREVGGLQKDAQDRSSNPNARYTATNALYSASFLLAHHDLCFKYQRKDWYYIEVDPRNTNILCNKLFKDKRVIIVSATPGAFDIPSHSASIHQRCGIYFAPVGNLTSHSLKQNPYLMSKAAKAIAEISTYMELCHDADRVVVHCGNLGTHAASLFKILGDDDCVLHQSGKLAETIESYLKSGKKYLLVAAAEYGGDFGWCRLQFVLKFPYPNLDERMRTLERTMGKVDFRAYYEGEARTRVIQMAGRNVRGFNDFGVTICLDSKVNEDYMKNKNKYPTWFQERVDTRCY